MERDRLRSEQEAPKGVWDKWRGYTEIKAARFRIARSPRCWSGSAVLQGLPKTERVLDRLDLVWANACNKADVPVTDAGAARARVARDFWDDPSQDHLRISGSKPRRTPPTRLRNSIMYNCWADRCFSSASTMMWHGWHDDMPSPQDLV